MTIRVILKLTTRLSTESRLSSKASISDDEIRERMSEWDEDGDGSINFAEFLSAMTRILTDTDNEERMKEAFQLFDKVSTFSVSQLQRSDHPERLVQAVV